MKYGVKIKGNLTLAPRTLCGFWLNERSAYLNIWHSYPIALY